MVWIWCFFRNTVNVDVDLHANAQRFRVADIHGFSFRVDLGDREVVAFVESLMQSCDSLPHVISNTNSLAHRTFKSWFNSKRTNNSEQLGIRFFLARANDPVFSDMDIRLVYVNECLFIASERNIFIYQIVISIS